MLEIIYLLGKVYSRIIINHINMNSIKTNDRSNQDTFIFIYSFGDLN